jgi:uncharacterized integral membrane protein (TIGR00697 family)
MEIETNNEAKIISFKDFKILAFLIAFVVILMAFSALTVQKVVQLPAGLTIPGASIWFSLISFPVMQIICTTYNKKFAHFTIFAGWVSMLVTTIMAQLTVAMPAAPVFEARSETFNFLLTSSIRYFLAATCSYVTTHAIINEFFSRLKFSKRLWLRSVVATVLGQFINTLVFISAMFIDTASFDKLLAMFEGTIIVRLCLVPFAVILVCLGVFVVNTLKNWKPCEAHETATEKPAYSAGLHHIFASFL